MSTGPNAPGDKVEQEAAAPPAEGGDDVSDAQPAIVIVEEGPPTPPPGQAGRGPGETPVGPIGIVLLILTFMTVSLVCLYGLLAFWPTEDVRNAPPQAQTQAETGAGEEGAGGEGTGETGEGATGESAREELTEEEPPPKQVEFFWWDWEISIELLFFLIVMFAGAIGGSVHAVRSLGLYIGSRTLLRSWIPFYLFKPIAGALAATVLYLVFRAGLFSPSESSEQASPYGFAALAAIVGLFTEHAVEKLRRVANELFNPPYEEPPPDHYTRPTTTDTESRTTT